MEEILEHQKKVQLEEFVGRNFSWNLPNELPSKVLSLKSNSLRKIPPKLSHRQDTQTLSASTYVSHHVVDRACPCRRNRRAIPYITITWHTWTSRILLGHRVAFCLSLRAGQYPGREGRRGWRPSRDCRWRARLWRW